MKMNAPSRRSGNDVNKKQIAQVECQTFGCFAIQKVAILTGRATYKWAEEKVINLWNTRAPIGDKNDG